MVNQIKRIMKELSIEEKAKAYDEAFRIAQELYNDPNSSNIGKGYVCTVFPELKESDDERIRKELINYFINGKEYLSLCSFSKEEILAWLEKQGEQKISYTTLVETGNGGINALVTRELPTNGCDDEQKSFDDGLVFDYNNIVTKQKDFAEIPFGAKDSEIQEAIYYIPKGYHAEINGDKVVIKRGEQKPIDYNKELKKCRENPLYFFDKYVKLKEQKPAWSEEDEDYINDLIKYFSQNEGLKNTEEDIVIWLKSFKERMKGE